MSKLIYRRMIFVVAILFMIHTTSYSQISSIRNQVFIGARPIGLGETFVAVADDGNAIYWNPAGLPYIDRYELQAMHTNLFGAGITNNYISFLIPNLPYLPYSEKLAFGLDWLNIGFGDDELDFSQNIFTFSIGYRPLKYFSLGLNVKYLANSASLDGKTKGKASGTGYDLGLFVAPWRNLRLGIMAHDLTDTKLHYENGVSETIFFRNIRCGAAYKFSDIFFINQPLVAIDIDDRIHLGAEFWLLNILGLRAGIQKDIYNYGEKEITYSFGTGIRYKFLQFDYAITNSPLLENTHRFSFSLNLSLPPSPVTIKSVEIDDIYASLYMHYRTFPCVFAKVDYKDEKSIECNLKFRESEYNISVDKKIEINPQPEESGEIAFSLNLPKEILKLESHAKYRTCAEVILKPKTFISTKAEKFVTSDFNIYGPGVLNWSNGADQAAAFMPSKDELITEFASQVSGYYRETPEFTIINKNISQAILIYDALLKYGIKYQRDPHTPYSQSSRSIDNVLYPFELLENKQGDCDDTTILYATLLENRGIHTMLVAVPRHILMMFDSGIHERERLMLCLDEDLYVLKNQKVWLPIETTFYCKGESFFEALKKGVEQYKNYQNEPGFEVVDVHEAWEKYEPVSLKKTAAKITIPEKAQIDSLYFQEKQTIDTENAAFLEENYNRPLRDNSSNLKKINELALIYILRGDIKKGEMIINSIMN